MAALADSPKMHSTRVSKTMDHKVARGVVMRESRNELFMSFDPFDLMRASELYAVGLRMLCFK